SPLPSGTVNVAYSAALSAVGGTGPYTFEVVSGNLPAGVTVSAGAISGTPTNAGTFLATIQVIDSSTPPVRAFEQLQLTIDPAGAATLRIRVNASPLPIGTVGSSYGPVTLTAAGGTGGPYTWSA